MASTSRVARLLLRPRVALLVGLIAIAAIALFLLTDGKTGTAAATTSSPNAAYQALSSDEPSGLPLVVSHHLHASDDPVGPTWPVEAPEGAGVDWPLASSIRKVSPGVEGVSVWIAKSIAGGICVLLYDGQPVNGVSAVAAGCSTSEHVDSGATIELSDVPGQSGRVYAAGVVPNGVTSVQSSMADGSTYTASVNDNAWARVTDVPAESGQVPIQITGGR
jgi:hypothetical protein